MRSTCKVLRMVSFLSCRINSPTNLTMPEMAVAVSDDATSFAPTSVLSSFACKCTWLSSATCNRDEQNSGNSHFRVCQPCPQHAETKAHSTACAIGMCCKQLLRLHTALEESGKSKPLPVAVEPHCAFQQCPSSSPGKTAASSWHMKT